MTERAVAPSSEPVAEPVPDSPSSGGVAGPAWASQASASGMLAALQRSGPRAAADVLVRLQRAHGNAAVGRMIARAPKTFATAEEAILDEILNQKRPDRLRQLFESVPAAKAKALVEGRLAPTSKDVLGVRFNADLSAELRGVLIAILRDKYEPKPAAEPKPETPERPDYEIEFEGPGGDDGFRFTKTRADPLYIDNQITQVARALGGDDNYLLFLSGHEIPPGSTAVLDLPGALAGKQPPVRLEPWRVDLGGNSDSAQETPLPDREAALAAVTARNAQKPGEYHAYHQAVYGMVVPTVFSPATTPRIIAMIEEVERQRAAEAEAAAEEFTIMAVALGLGLAAGAVVGAGLKLANRPKKAGPPGKPADPVAPVRVPKARSATVYGKEIPATAQGTLYHGTRDVPPEAALKGGLAARGSDMDLVAHIKGNPKSGMRGATRMPTSPGDEKQGASFWADEGGWVYEIDGVHGWDVNKILSEFPASPEKIEKLIRAEIEVTIPAEVPPRFIKRYGQVVQNSTGKLFVKDWVANPGFSPSGQQ